MSVYTSKVDRIDNNSRMPKYRQVVNTILSDIQNDLFKPGERIPSINETSEEYYLSRDTVEKAYRELSRRGIISSVPGKGYYVNPAAAIRKRKVLAVFNKLSGYKQVIYDEIVRQLGKHAICNLYVHRYNLQFFENLILDSLGEYYYYMLMPHFYDQMGEAVKVIKKIPKNKLIILDREIGKLGGTFGTVYQDFSKDIDDALTSGLDLIEKYQKLILVTSQKERFPQEVADGFVSFCLKNDKKYEIVDDLHQHQLSKGEAYLVQQEADLVQMIKMVRKSSLTLGKDLGIISYNDSPLKEVLGGGITVVTTDHTEMGRSAARMILDKTREKVRNPFTMIRRNSL